MHPRRRVEPSELLGMALEAAVADHRRTIAPLFCSALA